MRGFALKTYSFISPALFAAIRPFSRFNSRLRTFTAVRNKLFEELEVKLQSLSTPSWRLWVHAASVGEFEQARPIIASLQAAYPDLTVFVSFLSDSGYNARKNFSGASAVFYLPIDTPGNAKRLLSLLKPDLLMLMRYDFWPNHLLAAREAGTRMILAAAVLQENSQYFKPLLRGFYRSLFNLFDHIYTVSAKDTRAFREVFGCRQAETAGDPRFDQVVLRSRNTEKVSRLKLLYENRTVLLAGSVWPPDEALLLQAWLQLEKRPSLILVPHQVDPENMQRLCCELENRKISFMKASAIDRSFDPEQQVLLIDQTGYLAELYRLGSIAYIGGGFGVNVHNTLEPAVYGIPVLFGPRYHNSPEARELLLAGGATVIHDDTSLFTVLKNLTDDCSQRKMQGAAAAAFVQQRTGATALISGYIEKDYLKWKKKNSSGCIDDIPVTGE